MSEPQPPQTAAELPEATPSEKVRKQIDARVATVERLRSLYGKKKIEQARHHLQQAADIVGRQAAIDLIRL